jgi:hypothetical protein
LLGNLCELPFDESVDLDAIDKFLKEQERRIKLAEKTSDLAKRGRKYLSYNLGETWASRWVAAPVAYLFPTERREEWLGDLYEANQEMIRKGYPLLVVNVVNLGKTVILIASAIQIKIQGLLPLKIRQKE